MSLATQRSGSFRGQTRLSKYGNARLRTVFWLAAQSAVRMRENSLRRKFDDYVQRDPLNPDLRRKAYTAVAAKLARIVFGLIKSETDYRPFFEHSFQVDEPSRRGPLGRLSTP
jgi:transposase